MIRCSKCKYLLPLFVYLWIWKSVRIEKIHRPWEYWVWVNSQYFSIFSCILLHIFIHSAMHLFSPNKCYSVIIYTIDNVCEKKTTKISTPKGSNDHYIIWTFVSEWKKKTWFYKCWLLFILQNEIVIGVFFCWKKNKNIFIIHTRIPIIVTLSQLFVWVGTEIFSFFLFV